MPNHLYNETSPYLRQHAGNPVDWYPWGEAALDKARAEDKPIFLSIGYAACHWCHVMAHESFEDEQIAAILNLHFVSIKVDREERPDLDRIYMAAVQAMTGSGGWPMSVFLTPQGVPFYGGTYFPPQRRYGMPAFREVLLALADAWDKRRDNLLQNGQQVLAALREQNAAPSGPTQDLDPTVPEAALSRLQAQFDPRHGGWGDAPKFPQPMVLDFLLGYHAHSGDPAALDMAGQTLQAMARGGLYDQLGGGLHRYSVDAQWGTPHFEKMLYDNAQLARVYLHAWQVAGEPLYRAVVEETLDYVAREMTDPGGGFYATQDADSEGEEGKFYTWTVDEVQSVLGGDAPALMRAYDITPAGNLEGKNIPRWVGTWAERTALTAARQRLFEARRERVAPALDHKVLTSWNGLMLATLAEAARVLENARYQAMAIHNADFLLNHLAAPDGGLWHVWSDGQARIDGFLEDYACLIEGLIELYQTTFERRWYHAAAALAEAMLARFHADGQLYDTAAGQPDLIVRPRELQDNAVPSGSAMAARVLLRLGGLGLNERYIDLARRLIAPLQAAMARYPLGFGQWLNALDGAAAPPVSVAIAGDPGQADARALIAVCRAAYRPRVLVAAGLPDEAGVPLLRFREPIDGRATAYVCIGAVCRPPATDAAGLRALLDG